MKEIDAAFTAPGNATCRVDATTSDSVGEGLVYVPDHVHSGMVATMKTMTVSETRANFARVLDQVVEDREELVITRKAGDVVVVSRVEYESLLETLHLISSPANARALATAQRQVEDGDTVRHGLLRS